MKKTAKRTRAAARFERAQADAERAIGRGYEATLRLLPPRSRKAVKQLASQIGSTAEDMRARGREALRTVEKQGEALRERFELAIERRERVRAALQRRGAELVTAFERQLARAVKPFVRRFDIAAASEVEQLRKRLAQLERKLAAGARRAAA
jgi:hypothetical protein